MLDGFIKVDKETFFKYLKEYPNKLKRNVAGMFDPPIVSYNDFSKYDKWPDSIVCYVEDGEHSSIPTTQNEYYIKD